MKHHALIWFSCKFHATFHNDKIQLTSTNRKNNIP